MKAALLICLGAAALLAGTARAEIEVGKFAPDIDAKEWTNTPEPITLADLRGMTVVLFFWVSYHSGGEHVMETINIVESHPRLGRARGVFVIGLTDADRKRVERSLEKEKVFFPVGFESKAKDAYDITKFPSYVIVDPQGKVAWTGGPDQGNDLVKAVIDALEKNPPYRTHPQEAEKAHKNLDEARAALARLEYRAAFKAAREASEHALVGDPLKTKCQTMVELVEALGEDKLGEVDALVDASKFDQAIETLRNVKRGFRGMDVSKTARQRLEALSKDHDEIAGLVAAQEADARARDLLKGAHDDLLARRFGPAYDKLEKIIQEYPKTEIAADAAEVKERMNKHPLVKAEVREHKASRDCEMWLAQARTLINAGRQRDAKDLLRKVTSTYPDTRYADEADRLLITLP